MLLYKYVPPERVDVLEGGMIRYTPPILFNDPFESSPLMEPFDFETMERVSKIEAEHLRMPEENRLALLELFRDPEYARLSVTMLFKFFGMMFGTLSLSETNDNLLMWAHYTAQHTGFVVGLDTGAPSWTALEERRGTRSSKPTQVSYSKERPYRAKPRDLRPEDIWYTKSADWSYEREWRITRPLDKPDRFIEDDHLSLYEFPKDAVAEVVLGCRASEALEEKLRAILSTEAYRKCKLLRAREDEREYALRIMPAEPV